MYIKVSTGKHHLCDMTLLIDHQFKSPVWRFDIDSQRDILLIETRDAANKKVLFSSVCLKTGKIYFEDLATDERWLTGIEATSEGILLLHHYRAAESPVHKALIAIRAETGKTVWSNYNLAFDHLTINGPIGYDIRFQPKKLQLIDIQTGRFLREYQPMIDLELNKDLQLPDPVSTEFLLSLKIPVHPLENSSYYLERNKWRIVSLHAKKEDEMQQMLYLLDENNIIYHDLLHSGIQKMQPESFLIYKDQLIYLKNYSQLKVLNLPYF